MNTKLFSIYDMKAQCFNPVFCSLTKPMAARQFEDQYHQKDSLLARHPEDYFLAYLGELDLETGLITQPDAPEEICRATDYQPQKPE